MTCDHTGLSIPECSCPTCLAAQCSCTACKPHKEENESA